MCICVSFSSNRAWHTVFFFLRLRARVHSFECVYVIHRLLSSTPFTGKETQIKRYVQSQKISSAFVLALLHVWWWIVSCLRAGLPRQGTTQGSGIDTSALWRRQVQLDGKCKQIRGTNIFSGDTLQSVLCSVHVIVCVVTPHMQVHSISCPYTSQPCHYCRGLYPACWLGEHVNHCSYRRVTCEFCGYETAINLMDVSLLLCG